MLSKKLNVLKLYNLTKSSQRKSLEYAVVEVNLAYLMENTFWSLFETI